VYRPIGTAAGIALQQTEENFDSVEQFKENLLGRMRL
jgi:hypothetical protein